MSRFREDICPLFIYGHCPIGRREAAENGWSLLTRVRVERMHKACQSAETGVSVFRCFGDWKSFNAEGAEDGWDGWVDEWISG